MPGPYSGGKKKPKKLSTSEKQRPPLSKVRTGNFKISKLQAASGARN